jgi:hypothetical protein
MKNFIISILIIFSTSSCLEVLDLQHEDSEPLLIVEGKITNQPGPHFVTLSTTLSFNSIERAGMVDDAIVTISDDDGNEEQLTYLQDGLYESSSIQGIVGRTYFLTVYYEGITYSSQTTMLPISSIDTLFSKFQPSTSLYDEGYYVSLAAKLSRPDVTNFYRWMVYENDSLYNGINDILVSDDAFVEEGFEFRFDYPFELDDTVKIEMYSLNQDGLNYYEGFIDVLQSDGGLFSPPPVNAPSNISNGALGLFHATAVTSREIIIKK